MRATPTYFCYVNSDGYTNVNNANNTYGVCFGFYI